MIGPGSDINLAKYLFYEKDGNKYLEDICSMNGWSDKNAILSFFSRHNLKLAFTPNFIFDRPLVHVFLRITSQMFYKFYEIKYSFWNLDNFASSKGKIIVFRSKTSKKWIFTFKNFQNVYCHGKQHSAMLPICSCRILSSSFKCFHCNTAWLCNFSNNAKFSGLSPAILGKCRICQHSLQLHGLHKRHGLLFELKCCAPLCCGVEAACTSFSGSPTRSWQLIVAR